MYIVSACLAGLNCRYDGKSCENKQIKKLVEEGKAIPVCPEQLGGLSTPREPSEIKNNRVITKNGKDVTNEFYKGSDKAFYIARINSCKKAILKSNSPSCGCGLIYDGTFTGQKVVGDGFFAKILKENNIKIETEKDFTLEV